MSFKAGPEGWPGSGSRTMGRPLTIARLLAFVLLLGVCFAAMTNPSVAWSGIMFGLTLAALLTGVLCCVFRRGEARVLWAGFTAFGWAAFLVLFVCPDRFAGLATANIVYEFSYVIDHFDAEKDQAMADAPERSAARAFHERVVAYGQAITKSILILAFSALGVVSGWAFALQRKPPEARRPRSAAGSASLEPPHSEGTSSVPPRAIAGQP